MPLKTASLPELREANTNMVVALTDQLKDASFPYRGEHRTAAQRLDRYLEQRVLLENTSSKLLQVEAYGLKAWNAHFVRLAQITAPEHSKLSDAEVREAAWRAVPPGKFKRFQELFCDPHNYVVPRFTIDRRGNISFLGNPNFSKATVAGCLVSIDRIPDEFCEKVRLAEFTASERRLPVLRFKRKADIAVINRLKRLWDSCDVVSDRDFRVLIIQKPASEAENRYAKTGPFPVGLHGTLLFSSEDPSERVSKRQPPLGPKYSNPKRIAHFVTIYDAYRRTLHVGHGYDVEQNELVPLRTKVEMGRKRIDTEWKRGADQGVKDSVVEQVREALGDGSRTLKGDTNRHKVRAAGLMSKMIDSRDSTGRLNPRATSTVMARSERHIGSRLGEIRVKNNYNQTDEGLLNEIINAEETVLEQFRLVLAKNADAVMLPKRETPTRILVAPVRSLKPAEVMRRLVPDRQALESITARPFSTFAGLLRVGCYELEASLEQRRIQAAEQAVVKLHIVSKLFAANVNIERMKDYLIDPEVVPVDYLKREVRDVSRILQTQVLKGIHVEEYEKRFQTLARQIDSLGALLDASPGVRASSNDRSEYFKKLKRALDAIVPEKLAWELVPEKWRRASGQADPAKKS